VLLTLAAHTHEVDGLLRLHVAELREETGIPKASAARALAHLAELGIVALERGAVVGWISSHELAQSAQAFARAPQQKRQQQPQQRGRDMSAPREVLSAQESETFELVRVALMRAKASRAGGVAVVETCAPELARRIAIHVAAQSAALGLDVHAYAGELVNLYLRETREVVTRARHPLALLAQEIQLSSIAARVAKRDAATRREPPRAAAEAQPAGLSQAETVAFVARARLAVRGAP
jgi:hypothetical protein